MARSLAVGRPYLAMWVATLCVSSRSHKPNRSYFHRRNGKVFSKREGQSGNLGYCNANMQDEGQTSTSKDEAQNTSFQQEVQAICQILHENFWGDNAAEKLKQALKKLTANHVLEVLKRMENVEVSVGFFLWADAHVKKGDWGKAKDIYAQMASSGPSPDSITYNTLIDGLTKLKRMNDAYLLLGELIRSGYSSTSDSYNILMKGLCQEGRVNEAYCLMSNMLRNGCRPTVVTHNIMIDGMCKIGKVEDAAKILGAMHEFECSPDTHTYTVMINGYTEAGQMDKAWSLFLELKNKGYIPDVITYGVLMDGFCKANRLEAAFELLVEMLGRKISLNTIVYTMFLDCLCKSNKAKLAHTILDDMVCNHCIPDAITYRALMNGLSKSGQTSRAYDIMMSLVKENTYPSLSNCKALIDGLCKSGLIEEAMTWFDKLNERKVDIITYKLLIGSASRAGRLDDASKLLKKMSQAGFDTSRKYYLNIILGFCNQGRFDSACKVFEDLVSAKIILSEVTSKDLGDLYCDGRDTNSASTLLYKALENAPANHFSSFVEVSRIYKRSSIDKELNFPQEDEAPCFHFVAAYHLSSPHIVSETLSMGEWECLSSNIQTYVTSVESGSGRWTDMAENSVNRCNRLLRLDQEKALASI
ncbi:hypothetical protein GOP47_0016802 [Adiantum capillus-veneris]|uniref:Pentatricopeptide repeat-containing protein n=1 Tax=Adiantum capillus-veneris TaxID=13818 RepID=A0A9D4UJ18_ADICA|nr:hypothetical protein GOP47_0016802 [Adiantum capillus-veneris]